MRIVFMGTGEIGLPTLDWLLSTSKHEVAAVVTQPDKPVGRKQVLTPPEVKVRAEAAGVSVLQPTRLRHHVDELRSFEAEVFVVIAYGQLLCKEVLELPKHACLNIHASLLPKYRGAAPIQAAIREGDAESGATIMFMDEGLDTGDILLQDPFPLAPDETGGSLHDKLAERAPIALETALDLLAADKAPRTPQDDSQATHIGKLTRADGCLDWSKSSTDLERLVRAYTPWPGTFTTLTSPSGGKSRQLKVHGAENLAASDACPAAGTILSADSDGLVVACGSGSLRLTRVQVEGGKRLPAADFLRGHPLEVGQRLGEKRPTTKPA
jgi:methionyl-tRNA formyltransferase